MKNHLIAHRYAKALSESIDDPAQCEQIREWLSDLIATLAEHPELRTTLLNPAIAQAVRAAVLDDVLAKIDGNPLGANFARTVLKRKRITMLEDIARVFSELVDQRLNRITAKVTSARLLADSHRDRIREGLARKTNKDVRLETAIDPDILGGVVVRIDGTILDGSLRTRLEQLRSALLSKDNES